MFYFRDKKSLHSYLSKFNQIYLFTLYMFCFDLRDYESFENTIPQFDLFF